MKLTLEAYLKNEAQTFKVGQWIVQKRSNASEYAVIIGELKNKGWSVISIDDDRMKPAKKSTKYWDPAPTVISEKDVPEKIKKKMFAELKKRGLTQVL